MTRADAGAPDRAGIMSNPFLDYAFNTLTYAITVAVHADGTASCPRAQAATAGHQA